MREKTKQIFVAALALSSGFCNALLGAGGGILLLLSIGKLYPSLFSERKHIFANAQAAMIPGCAVSCLLYTLKDQLSIRGFSVLAIPAILGGALGSILLTKLNNRLVAVIFAVLVIWSGGKMLFG